MIHDATGKFSSRWVFPDRSSLALVIGIGCTCWTWPFRRLGFENTGMQDRSRTPYMGNSRAKPMLSPYLRSRTTAVRIRNRPGGPCRKRSFDFIEGKILLPVACQHLAARGGQLWTILLQARQNDEIALIHQWTAKPLHVARTGLLLGRRTATLLLSDCSGRNGYR